MADCIKTSCPECSAKYRLPIESQGRSVRCKRCSHKFQIPQAESSLDDSIMAWLDDEANDEATTLQPKVIQIPSEELAAENKNDVASGQTGKEVSTTKR
ncbi:MAG: zinc-ribbon domain-containing protein [Phycisphaerae bacterium]